MTEYKSWEEKYLGKEAPFGRFLREAGIMGGGAVLGMLRLPTTLRKSTNKQTRVQRMNSEYKHKSEFFGAGIGFIGGCTADVYLATYALQEASQDNYIPAIVFGTTNIASLLFEFGRYSKIEKKLAKLEK